MKWRISRYNVDSEKWEFLEVADFESTEELDQRLCDLSNELGTATRAKEVVEF